MACVVLGIAMLLRISHFDVTGGLAYRWPPFDFARCVVEFCFGMLVFRAYAGESWLKVLGQDRWTWVVAAFGVLALLGRSDLVAAAVFPFLVLAFALNRGNASRILRHAGSIIWGPSRSRSIWSTTCSARPNSGSHGSCTLPRSRHRWR